MLHLRHACELGDARFCQDELRSPDLLVVRSALEAMTLDGAFDGPLVRPQPWAEVMLVERGRAVVRAPGGPVELGPGEAWVSPLWQSTSVRTVTSDASVVQVGWRIGGRAGDAPPSGRLRLSARPVDGGRGEPLAAARRLLDELRSLGVPLADRAAEAAGAAVAPAHALFGRALEATLFPLQARPMGVDLARHLGCSERHAMRLASAYFACMHVTVSSWRQYVSGMKLALGLLFMSHPGARTDRVSALLGFSSPTAFCHSLQQAGLPSPGAVRASLQAMLLAPALSSPGPRAAS